MKKKEATLTCDECGARCCRYVATQIDTPSCKRDYDHIRWFLLHENVHVFIDHERHWLVEFETACSELAQDHLCRNYANRPRICRHHGDERDCEFLAGTEPHVIRFSTVGEFDAYMDKRGIDWRWKRDA